MKGHTGRRSGAQWLARAGVPKSRIMDFARWGSNAIDAYVEEVLLEQACTDLSTQACATNLPSAKASEIEAASSPAPPDEAIGAESDAEPAVEYVVNRSSGAAHIVRPGRLVRPREAWTTACGRFKFGRDVVPYEIVTTPPSDEALCKRCRS